MFSGKRLRTLVGVFLVVSLAVLADPASTALAVGVPNAQASCVGQEAAGISPPGSSDEFFGGVPEIVSSILGSGGSVGSAFSAFAKAHGTHEACDIGG
jgi:hypothetical protein